MLSSSAKGYRRLIRRVAQGKTAEWETMTKRDWPLSSRSDPCPHRRQYWGRLAPWPGHPPYLALLYLRQGAQVLRPSHLDRDQIRPPTRPWGAPCSSGRSTSRSTLTT